MQSFLDNYVNVKKLISKGADKNAKNNIGRTPLHLGCQKGQILTFIFSLK